MKPRKSVDLVDIAIVDDEREVREGLRYLLGLDERIHISASFSRAEDLLDYLKQNPRPDIVLMDIHLPSMNGIVATRRLQEEYPAVIVLILTVFEEEEEILASIRAGARGYILKNTRPEILLEQILSALNGGSPISPTVARRLLDEIKREEPRHSVNNYSLTAREREVLKDIVEGLTYKELAERHHIAGSTAKKHILHIYQKLHVSSKAEIVRKALSEKLI